VFFFLVIYHRFFIFKNPLLSIQREKKGEFFYEIMQSKQQANGMG
jgi:hypothetical protein